VNPVYIRIALYTLATAATAAGLGTFDAEAGTLTLNLNDIAAAIAGAGFVNGAVFAIWGKK
jgi:hypothetical protein